MSRYPKEAQLFELTENSNEHWRKGDLVELLEVECIPYETDPQIADYRVRHHCGEWSHLGYMWSLDNLRPLTPAARQMLAIARGGTAK